MSDNRNIAPNLNGSNPLPEHSAIEAARTGPLSPIRANIDARFGGREMLQNHVQLLREEGCHFIAWRLLFRDAKKQNDPTAKPGKIPGKGWTGRDKFERKLPKTAEAFDFSMATTLPGCCPAQSA